MSTIDEKAYEFFKLFARIEYSLKASGFHCGNGNATANWENFALSIDEKFTSVTVESFKEAVKYIKEHPPKKQIISDGSIEWLTIPPQSKCEADLILLYIRRVRNNLFHGGKFNGHWFEPERSEELITHSIVILHKAISLSVNVKAAFGQ
ncbi:hypothetical protein [Moritella yayanosii]|uniref:Apea-like HEPN domain-containing protein n=1 Tax=Moritella yayanosii TaxID=69539 RepID=A0A330LLN3_9GAMM|nr:hypothetical protein [Moritella yayanosii]SQD77603.1 conserved protein of unknown function [Moritella yayanosii]